MSRAKQIFFSENQNFFHLLYHPAPGHAGILNYTYTHKGKG